MMVTLNTEEGLKEFSVSDLWDQFYNSYKYTNTFFQQLSDFTSTNNSNELSIVQDILSSLLVQYYSDPVEFNRSRSLIFGSSNMSSSPSSPSLTGNFFRSSENTLPTDIPNNVQNLQKLINTFFRTNSSNPNVLNSLPSNLSNNVYNQPIGINNFYRSNS
jgi:hypothetical protein